ncbi:MAG: hypothetical protein IJW25_00135, partial [Clostridia bacterium]|nr:hypothetical protein [Clostridia bacterium]
VDASILYDPTLANKEQAVFSLEYLNASATLVQNESFTGTLSVSKEKYTANSGNNTFTASGLWKTGNTFDWGYITLEIDNISNYTIYLDINLEVHTEMKVGDARLYVNDITYSGKNIAYTANVNVERLTASGLVTHTAIYGNNTEQLTIVGFYASRTDAENKTNSLTTVKNVGTYFVRATSYGEDLYTQFNITPYNITTASVTKVYDGNKTQDITNSYIFDADKNYLTLTATYASANAGTHAVSLSLTAKTGYDSLLNNYTTDEGTTGTITAKSVIISKFTQSKTYTYKGAQTIDIPASDLSISGLLSGHTLSGCIKLDVSDVNKSYFVKNGRFVDATGKPCLTVLNGQNDVTANYAFSFTGTDDNFKLTLTKAVVTIKYNGENLTYNGLNQLATLKQNLELSGEYVLSVDDINGISFTNNNGSSSEIKYAGTYTINVPTNGTDSISGNITYKVDATANTVTVNKKDVTINIGTQLIKYIDYVKSGYNLEFGMFDDTSRVAGDKSYIEAITYSINGTLKSGQTYSAANDITFTYNDYIINNYNITSKSGSITLTAENLTFADLENRTYNGQNQLDDITITYTNETSQTKTITLTNTTNGAIVGAYSSLVDAKAGTNRLTQVRNAGDYVIKLEINTAFYYVELSITKLQLTAESLNVQYDKAYDGTNTVKTTDNKPLTSSLIC